MVGEKGHKVYSVAVTSAGQMTLPKVLREKYGIFERAEIDEVDGQIIVRRAKTTREILDEAYAMFTPKEKRIAKSVGGRLAKDILAEYRQTDKWKKYAKEKYGA